MKNKLFKSTVFKIGIFLLSSSMIFCAGYCAKKYHFKGILISTLESIVNKNVDIPKDLIGGIFSKPKIIRLEFTDEHYAILMNDRKVALNRGTLLDDHNEEVPVLIYYDDEKFKAKVKLKGDYADHFGGDKFSLRFNIKGNKRLMGLDEFALQPPKTRSFLKEWIYHMLEVKENLIHLKTEYVQVIINGKKKGIYQMEEFFDNTIKKNNGLVEGIIFRQIGPGIDLKIYNEKKIYSSLTRKKQLSVLYEKYDSFVEGRLPVNEVFDIEKMAKWYAITDLLNGYHMLYNNNLHFYFNSETQLIEPIGREVNDFFKEVEEICIEMVNDTTQTENPLNYWLHKKIFKNELFICEYYKVLLRISNHNYLDEFFSKLNKEMENNLNIIYKDYPLYKFDKFTFYWNQRIIQEKLCNKRPIKAYYINTKEGKHQIFVKNLSAFPLILKSVINNDEQINIQEKIILYSNVGKPINKYHLITLPFKNKEKDTNTEIIFSFLGADQEIKYNVLPWIADGHPNDFIQR